MVRGCGHKAPPSVSMFQIGFDLVTTISQPKAAIIEAYNNRLTQDSKDSTPDSLKDGKETT